MITRRQFTILGAGGVAVAGGALVVRRLFGHRVKPPTAPADWRSVPVGPLSDAQMQALLATVTAFFDVTMTAHYSAMFSWRATTLKGDRGVYAAFVDAMTKQLPGYATATRDARLAANQRGVFLTHEPQGDLFYTSVIDLIFIKYAATDGWIAQGYDAWPGMPRGFDSYKQPAPGDAAAKSG
jgi:hypothetical protein